MREQSPSLTSPVTGGDVVADPPPVRLGVIGPLQVLRAGSPVRLPASVQLQTLFGVLLLTPGQPRSVAELAEVVWGRVVDAGTVHVAVSRLRRWLRDHIGGALTIERDVGYFVNLGGCWLDLVEFTALVQASSGQDPAAEFAALHQALALRRGDVLEGLTIPGVHSVVTHVDEMIRSAGHRYAGVAMSGGDPLTASPVLDQLTACYPLDEALHAGAIEVLAAAGRPAEAIWRFEQLRARLADELGVDPSPEVRSAYLKVLRQHLPARSDSVPEVHPDQLPADIADFVGRPHEVATICDQL